MHVEVRALFATERGVSPVIGVILMVAIVVVLAAVVGTFVLGVGVGSQSPRVAFDFEFEDAGPGGHDELTIVHRGGQTIVVGEPKQTQNDAVAASNVLIVSSKPFEDDRLGGIGDGFECDRTDPYVCPFNFDDEFTIDGEEMSAGDVFRIYAETPSTEFEDAEVQVVWRSESGDATTVLAEWTGPGA